MTSNSTTNNMQHLYPKNSDRDQHSNHRNIINAPSASMDELAVINLDDDIDRNNNGDTESSVKSKHITLPRSSKGGGAPDAQSRIPRIRQIQSTFAPIDKPLSQKPSTDNKKRTGTPLQELDRKWALDQCEELTTWTNDLLRSRGGRLNHDLRKAISDGTTLPMIIEIAFESTIDSKAGTAGALSDNDRHKVLADCIEYLNSHQLTVDISAAELFAGDLKAVLTVLSAIKQKMGQRKSKLQPHKSTDQTQLLPYDVIKQEVDNTHSSPEVNSNGMQEISKRNGRSRMRRTEEDAVVITHGQSPVRQHTSPIKILTTFQSPPFSKEPTQSRLLKSSLSMDNIDGGRRSQDQSSEKPRISTRSSSSISINVDSGEKEYHRDWEFEMPHSSLQAAGEITPDSNDYYGVSEVQRLASSNSYNTDDQIKQQRAKMVRGQPSGESNPATPSVRDTERRLELSEASTTNNHLYDRPGTQERKSRPVRNGRQVDDNDREQRIDTPPQITKNFKSKEKEKQTRKHTENSKPINQKNSVSSANKRSHNSTGSVNQRSHDSMSSANQRSHDSMSSANQRSHNSTGSVNQRSHNSMSSANQKFKARSTERKPNSDATSHDPNFKQSMRATKNKSNTAATHKSVPRSSRSQPPSHLPLMPEFREVNREILGVMEEMPQYLSTSTSSTITPPPSEFKEHSLGSGQEHILNNVSPITSEQRHDQNHSAQSKRAKAYQVPQDYYEPVPVEQAADATITLSAADNMVKVSQHHQPANSDFNGLTETQIRRLSMPMGYQYSNGEAKHTPRNNSHISDNPWADNNYNMDDEHWIDGPENGLGEGILDQWKDLSKREDNFDFDHGSRLENSAMVDSFYDNANAAGADSNDSRPTTPSLPALTDTTDIESVTDALHIRRYKRSASFSDRIQFIPIESTRLDSQEMTNKTLEKESSQTGQQGAHVNSSKPPVSRMQKKVSPKVFSEDEGESGTKERNVLMRKGQGQIASVGKRSVDAKKSRVEGVDREEEKRRHSATESIASSQRSYSGGTRRTGKKGRNNRSSESRTAQKKIQRIESHIVTLARSVAHISSEMKSNSTIYFQLESLSAEISSIKEVLEAAGLFNPLSAARDALTERVDRFKPLIDSKDRAQKLNKLTKFFGQEPPLMKLFLKDLGYEKYSAKFESEKIGLLELPYMSDEALKSIGIPLGPRTRILQEAKVIRDDPHPQPTQVTNGAQSTSTAVEVSDLSGVTKLSTQTPLASKPFKHSKKVKPGRREQTDL